jgi:hypothetical protein
MDLTLKPLKAALEAIRDMTSNALGPDRAVAGGTFDAVDMQRVPVREAFLRSPFYWKPPADAPDAKARPLILFYKTAAMRPEISINCHHPRSAETANSCVILSSSTSADSISSDRTTNLFPSSQCASTIQIVRPRFG